MILMSLLLVLSMERLVTKQPHWHIEKYAEKYRAWTTEKGWLSKDTTPFMFYTILLMPALLLAALEYWLLGTFLTFIEQSLVLFVCIGCPALRATYKCYLNAAHRGDVQACSMYTDQLGHCTSEAPQSQNAQEEGRSFGQHLTWLNYQHYAAVMLFFVAFGGPGALFYALSRSTTEMLCNRQHPLRETAINLMFALDYIPVRITAFGMLMMGHFSRALSEWLNHVFSLNVSAYTLLTQVSSQAEMLTPEEQEAQQNNAAIEPQVLVKLAKRNVIFLLVLTSALTVVGSLA
ncbi:beta-lactamase regulator AmpE [Alteromonas sp. A079]|uniref:beta-lactamase regulator AmpE n=1 Tax=Alteromonas sp. A079 TaxID=3410268 RepID=UPI003BA0F0B5